MSLVVQEQGSFQHILRYVIMKEQRMREDVALDVDIY